MNKGENNSECILNFEEWTLSIKKRLNHYGSLSGTPKNVLPIIHKVQDSIRLAERNAYEPLLISIGPYYYGNPSLAATVKDKWASLDYILKLNYERSLEDYIEVLSTLTEHVRNSYSPDIQMDEDKFLKMLLLDGCFILVFLYGTHGLMMNNQEVSAASSSNRGKIGKTDAEMHTMNIDCSRVENMCTPTQVGSNKKVKVDDVGLNDFNNEECIQNGESLNNREARSGDKEPWYNSFVAHDLLLLENQIPFFVVKRTYELLAGNVTTSRLLTDNISKCVEGILFNYPKSVQVFERPRHFHHLLQLCHMYFRPSQRAEEYQPNGGNNFFGVFCRKYLKVGNQQQEYHQDRVNNQNHKLHGKKQLLRWRRAEQYHDAGIEFKKRDFSKSRPHSLVDIEFIHGVVEIPFLMVDDKTGFLFRNLIAFEQACPQFGNYFTAYICFISRLVSMPTDVTLLAKRGIIVHEMRSDDQVSILFAKLGKNVDFDVNGNHYLRHMCCVMEEHYQSRVNRWMAWLWQNHFSNPWLSLAVIAGAVVLVCTIVQSLLALVAYIYMEHNADCVLYLY